MGSNRDHDPYEKYNVENKPEVSEESQEIPVGSHLQAGGVVPAEHESKVAIHVNSEPPIAVSYEDGVRAKLESWYEALEVHSETAEEFDAMFLEKYFMHGNSSNMIKNALLALKNKTEIIEDYNYALFVLRKLTEQYHASENEEKRGQAIILGTLRDAIIAEAANVEIRHLPLLTEMMVRFMHKVEKPYQERGPEGQPVNPINGPKGQNTRRGLALSEEISSFKWGKLIGGLGMLVLGGVLVAGAVLTLMASFGAAAPLSAVLIGLGVQAATPAAITAIVGVTSAITVTQGAVAGSIAAGAGYVGVYGVGRVANSIFSIYTSFRDKFSSKAPHKAIKQTVDTLFKPAPEEKPSGAVPSVLNNNSPSSRGSKNGGG